VTFGGTQLRNCSASSGSSRSSTSGSHSSRHCDVFNTGKSFEATQVISSSISEVEDFQAFPAQSRSRDSRHDTDPVTTYKKAKMTRDSRVRGESPLVHSASKRSQSFASLEQSLTETDADDDHFWSKVSSPQNENSFVRHNDYDVESPCRRNSESRSYDLRLSFLKTYDEPAHWPNSWQDPSTRSELCHERRNKDPFQQPSSVQCMNTLDAGRSVSKDSMHASHLQSEVSQREYDTNSVRAGTCDVSNERREAAYDAANTARSNKWWAFVNGITSQLSPPGHLITTDRYCSVFLYTVCVQLPFSALTMLLGGSGSVA